MIIRCQSLRHQAKPMFLTRFSAGDLLATKIQVVKQGSNPKDISLSKRELGDPPQHEGANKGITVPLAKLRRCYWSAMGFNPETGATTPECLARLNLIQ